MAAAWTQWLPRARGDGPKNKRAEVYREQASPRTRGWTRQVRIDVHSAVGFPAHAGMDPSPPTMQSIRSWLPRARGDGPLSIRTLTSRRVASPRTRGWTPASGRADIHFYGFPAHAGMDPGSRRPPPARQRLPRARGDGPIARSSPDQGSTASPRTRGWTLFALLRGSSRSGFPAHAGMDP